MSRSNRWFPWWKKLGATFAASGSRAARPWRFRRLRFEPLEDRRLLTAVVWTGAGGDTVFTNPNNWSTGLVPGASDDVTIGPTGSPTVTDSGFSLLNSILVASGDTLSITGGLFGVAAPSNIDGTLSVSNATLEASGAGATLTANGTTTFSGMTLLVQAGGQISVPNLSASNALIASATGTGSSIDLSGLTSLTGTSRFETFHGAQINVSSLVSSTASLTVTTQDQNSNVNLSALTSLTGTNSSFQISAGGSIPAANLATFTNGALTINGPTVSLPKLSDIDSSSIVLEGGSQLSLPLVTSYANSNSQAVLETVGAGSILKLNNLTSINASATVRIVTGGGEVDLKALPSVTSGNVQFESDNAGSVIDLSTLTSMTGDSGNELLTIGAGSILIPLLATFQNGTIDIQGGTLTLAGLTNIDGSNVDVSNAGQLSLPSVATYTNSLQLGGNLSASGFQSKLTLAGLTTIVDPSNVIFTAGGGSQVNLPVLATASINTQFLVTGGTINLPALTRLTGGGDSIEEFNTGGQVFVPNLTRFNNGKLVVSSVLGAFPLLTNIDGLSITVTLDGLLALPGVTSYVNTSGLSPILQASDLGTLSLPKLTSLAAANLLFINALPSGDVEFGSLVNITGTAIFTATGSQGQVPQSSLINLPALKNLSNSLVGINESNNGQIAFPNLNTLQNITINADPNGTFTLQPSQTFSVNTNFNSIFTGTVVDLGTLSAESDGQISIPSTLEIDGLGALSIGPAATLRASGDLLGSTTNADQFQPTGTVQFTDLNSSDVLPQHLEAMSADLGPTDAGFVHNFAYGTIQMFPGDHLQLVDQSGNSPGAAPEAVYVDQLSVPAGATLDLNGLNLYVHTASIGGMVFNGSISGGGLQQVTPSVLALGAPTGGTIATSGQINSATFSGQAGQVVTVQLNPDGGADPHALLPQLGFGEVTLLDPNGHVLATRSGVNFSDLAVLSNITLPTSGIYTIQVQAATSQPTSTGNYVLTAYNVITHFNSLTFNQAYSATLGNSQSTDQWTFSAAAGQQVDLHPANPFGSSIEFDLTGPGGTVFVNQLTDTGPVNLPSTGNYVLTVHSGGGNNLAYGFHLDATSVVNLTLGNTYNGALGGNGFAQLFAVTVPANQSLFATLKDGVTGDVNELYARFGAAPTRGQYDASATLANAANQQLLVPSAVPGTWYFLVYGNTDTAGSPFTLQVTGQQVKLTDVTPRTSAAGSVANLVLSGSGFSANTSVQLIAANNTVYNASSVSLDTYTQLTATFDLTGVPQGTYSVQVTNPGNQTDKLTGAFTVTAPGQAHLTTQLLLPGAVGRHIASTFYVVYSNTGSAAMPAPVLQLESSNANDVPLFTLNPALQTAGFYTSAIPLGYSSTVQILASGKVPGVLEPGESVTVPVYYAGMQQPWDLSKSTFNFDVRIFQPTDTTAVNWSGMQASTQPPGISTAAWNVIYGGLLSQLGTTLGGYVQLLDNEAKYLGQLGENVTDIGQLWQFATLRAGNSLSPVPQQALAADLSVPTAGTLPLDFSRQFLSSIVSRNTLGPLGYGWTDIWQNSLAVGADGTVTVTTPTGAQRVFQPDSRGGNYFAQAGDYGILRAASGGGFNLQETDGQVKFFNADGTLGYIQDTNGNRITTGYDAGRLASLTSSSGGSLTINYNASGLIGSVSSSDGRTVNYTYDGNNQLTQVQRYDGTVTQYGYDTSGNLVTAHALVSIQFADNTHQFFTYDTLGRLAGSSQDGGADPVTFSYNVGEVTVADASADTSKFFYNERGLLVKTVDPLGNASFATYDGNFNLTGATGPTGLLATFAYDKKGNLITGTNPLGQTSSFTYTGAANLLASYTNAQGSTTSYQYDSAGNLTSTVYADGTASSATYDALGDPLSIINQKGQVTSSTYNAVGQVTGETLADGTTYTFTYDAHGDLFTAVSAAGTIALSYDAGDRLTEIDYPNGQFLKYTYDVGGRRMQMVDQAGNTVNYNYTTVGQLAGLTDGNNAPIVTYTYNNLGQLTVAVDGNGTGSGLGPYTSPYTTHQYDAAGHLLHLVNYASGATVNSRFDYTYNALGQIATMATLDGGWTYSYDTTGQLIHATFASTNGAIPSQDLTYVYNAAGNRTQTIVNGVTSTYTSNIVHEYTTITSTAGTTTDTYDADGNLVSKTDATGTTTYGYDSLDRLISVTSPTDSFIYQYDALGNLASTIHNGQVGPATTTQNLVDPTGLGKVVGQYDGSGNLLANYTYGLGLVSQITPGGTNYYQFDALGSTAGLINSAGVIQNSYSYLPFGGLLHSTGSAANPFTFVGQFGVSSDGNGLLNMRARSYDPTTGQFSTNDPIGLRGGDTNLRRYAANNPIDLIDPVGTTGQYAGDSKTDQELLGPNYAPSGEFGQPDVFFTGAPGADSSGSSDSPGISADRLAYDRDLKQKQRVVAAQEGRNLANQEELDANSATNFFSNIPSNLEAAGKYSTDLLDGLTRPPNPPGGGAGGAGATTTVNSKDPNALIGPAGFGVPNFVAAGTVFPYEIDFENDPTATAPAQAVTVSDPLNPNLDPSTFQLRQIAFGDTVLTVPPANGQHYETTVSMTYNHETFNVQITAGIDLVAKKVFATFQSLDPNTGLPPDVLTGFLPPENGTGRGSGRINYTIQAKSGLATGTQIRNVATIVFDQNSAIATDQVSETDPSQGVNPAKQALVTIDAGPPTSTVNSLPVASPTTFNVSWGGSDDANGSGIARFDVYVSSDNNGAFTLWQSSTAPSSASYTGVNGHTYSFYSVATDNVGNVQPTPTSAQASTMVSSAPSLSSVSLTPTTAYKTSTLTATPMGGTDPNGETISYSYQWFVNNTAIAPTTSTLAGTYFSKGNTVYVQVTPSDATTIGTPVNSNTITIQDSAPSLTSASLTPSTAYKTSTLTATPNGGADADGDTISYSYQWFVNGSAIAPTTSTLTGTYFNKGNTVYVRVTPSDGTASGTPVNSITITIQDSAPSLTSVRLTPATAYKTSTLTATPVGGTDADGDTISYSYQWFVNNTAIAPTSSTLAGTYFNRGNTVYVRVTPNDGTVSGTPVNSITITIQDSAPSITSVSLTPTTAYETSTLTATPMGGTDADGDTISYSYQWFVNNTAIAPTTSTLAPGNFHQGDSVYVRVTPSDGSLSGTPVNSSTVTIQQSTSIATSILVLDQKASGALSLSGNTVINETGAVVVDSNSATAIQVSGNAQVTASSIRVVGGVQKSGNAAFHPTPTTGSGAVADPYLSLAAPPAGTARGSVNIAGQTSLTINPGVYGQIIVAGNATLKLNPGIYEIAGGGFNVAGNATVSGTGVLIYNAGSAFPNAGGSFGSINFSGNGSVNFMGATSGGYTGIAIFQSRDNKTTLQLSGNALLGSGTVYAPSALLSLSGNSNLSGTLIVDELALSGNADPSPVLPARQAGLLDVSHSELATSAVSAVSFQPGMVAALPNASVSAAFSDGAIQVSAASSPQPSLMASPVPGWVTTTALRNGTELLASRSIAFTRSELSSAKDTLFDLGGSIEEVETWWHDGVSPAQRLKSTQSLGHRMPSAEAGNALKALGRCTQQSAAFDAAIVAWEQTGLENDRLEQQAESENEATEPTWAWTVVLALLGWCHFRISPKKQHDRQRADDSVR